jgi:hypothetical protein
VWKNKKEWTYFTNNLRASYSGLNVTNVFKENIGVSDTQTLKIVNIFTQSYQFLKFLFFRFYTQNPLKNIFFKLSSNSFLTSQGFSHNQISYKNYESLYFKLTNTVKSSKASEAVFINFNTPLIK